ncbi:uncharacterized protein G2W53_036954 [Senna tora]|uniref:RNase H type-1 domain-containing protein n=1 Tax=Senna tora TaxID=362788 RepID=A0A834SWE1_9FABA|nr:uncharacterized protein G2W53_036954 [Senna tora]
MCVGAFSCKAPAMRDAALMEAMGMKKGIEIASDGGISHLIVESDAKPVVDIGVAKASVPSNKLLNRRFKCTTNTVVDAALECRRSYHPVVSHKLMFVTRCLAVVIDAEANVPLNHILGLIHDI